jgi:hypothetical protein
MLNVEHVSTSVGIRDAVVDAEFISGVDPQQIATGFTLDVDPPFVKLEFMSEYEAVFGDGRAEDSADDRSAPELSNRDKLLLQQTLAEHDPEVLDYQDLSHAHRVVADGLQFNDNVSLINHDNVIIPKSIIYTYIRMTHYK